MIVVDASVLCEHVLGRAEIVEMIVSALDDLEPLHAPELIEPETLSALRRLASTQAVTEARASEAVGALADLRLIRYPHAPFRERAWELRHILTPYDAMYLALAEALDDPLLMTADRGLAGVATAQLGPDRVRRL